MRFEYVLVLQRHLVADVTTAVLHALQACFNAVAFFSLPGLRLARFSQMLFWRLNITYIYYFI